MGNIHSPLYSDLCRSALKLDGDEFYKFCILVNKYEPYLTRISSSVYEHLDKSDRPVFINWFLCRWGGVNVLPEEALSVYRADVAREMDQPYTQVKIDGKSYRKRNYFSQGYDFDLIQYDWVLGIHDILYDQYEYKDIKLHSGDTVIDAGAFIGDTAVLFSHKLAGECDIHSFELSDENIALMKKNLDINGIQDKVKINKLALSSVSGKELHFNDSGIQGAIKIKEESGDKPILSTTIDDYVEDNNLQSVDFIKMDIEGSELEALQGAEKTIKRFQPNLAICLYHKWQDPYEIPEQLLSYGVGYKFRFKWVHLTKGWEAVLLATKGESMKSTTLPPDHMEVVGELNKKLINLYAEKYNQADTLWKKINNNNVLEKVHCYFRKNVFKV